MEAPELEEELATRPVEEIIDEIRRDLGVYGELSLQFWKRRTPADVAALNARAAAPYRKAGGPIVPPAAKGEGLAKMAAHWRDDTRIRGP
jgi:hypothetical protein